MAYPKTYKTDKGVFEIPEKEVGAFLKDFPNAMEVVSYKMGKDTFDIPVKETEVFLKENPQATPLKKKEPSDNGLQEPLDGGLLGTTSTTDLPTISQDELDKQGDVIGKIQEADRLSKATKDISMPSSGKGGQNVTTIPDYNSISKSKEILNSLKGEGYNDDDIAILTETFRDLPPETETYGKDAPYSKKAFLELYKENPIAAITKANNVKNYFALMKTKGQEKASEFNKLSFQDDPSIPVNQRIDRFDNQKNEQKKLIEENLSGVEKDKALQRIDRNASIILGNIFNDPQKAKEYLEQKLEGKDIQLKNPTILESKSKVEGDLGNFSLKDIAKNIDEDSPAQRMAYDRYKYSANLSDALNNLNIYDAAIGFAAAQDDRLAAQIDKLGGTGLPKAMQGQLVNEFMNLPEVKQRAEQYPEYAAALQQAKSNLYFTYPEFAKKEVGQKIAQAREDLGYNNWFANVPTKGGTDELVDKLISEGKMTEQDKLVYQNQIRPSLGAWESVKRGAGRIPFGAFIEESPIPTSGLLETTQNSMNRTIHGMARSIEDAVNAVVPGEPFSDKERLYSTLKENSEIIPLIPREGFHKAVMGTGNLTGFVIPMIAGGAALKGVKGAEFINNALLFEGENKSRALELFPNNETAQYLYTGAATIGDMTLGKLIPAKESGKGFGDLLKKDITDVLNKFTNQEISAAAAKQNILDKAYDIVPKFLKENTKTAAVITGFGAFHNGLDALFGGNDMSAMDVATKAVEYYNTNFLSTGVLAALAVKGKQSGIAGKLLMEVSSKPDVYERIIKDEANLNPELASSAKEKIDNLKDAAAIRKDLDKTDMTDAQKEKYLITALNKKILERKASETSDQSLKEKYKKEAEQHNTDNLILQAELGDKEFKDLTPEEKERIELPKGISIKTQPSGTEGKFTPYIVNENGEHEVLNRSFDTPEAAKIYGEDAVKRKYFDNNIKNKKEQLPDLTVPIEGTDKKGVPIGEDVPAEVKGEPENISQPIELSTEQTGKGDGDWSRDVESTANKLKETEQKNPSLWQKIKDAAKNVLKSIKNIGKYEYEKRKSFVDDIKFEEYPNDKEGFIELWKDGKKIGEMNVHYGSDNNLGIKWVSIKPEFRGKGLSLLLYGKATEIAKEKGFNGVASGFSTHETAKTNSLYKHFNLIDLGESKGSNDGFNGRKVILHDLKDNTSEHNAISEAYHKAKADGSNPELVKAVEDLLGKPKTQTSEQPTKPVTKPIPEVTETTQQQGIKEPVEPVGEGSGNEDWTHINKKDITDAEDLASKHPFGESESWKNSVKKGLEKLAKIAKKGESLYDVAKNKVNEWAAKVKQEILDDGKSTFNPSDEEIAQMAYHRTMTNKKIAELEPDLTSPIQAVRDAAEIVLSDLEAQKEMVDYVLHNTATTAGRAFNIRQMVSNIDAENGLQVKRMDIIRKQKGQPLSEKQEQEIRDIHDEEIKNQKAKDEYAQKKAQQDFEEAVKAEVDRRMKAKKDKAASDKVNKTPTEKRAKIADKLNEWADKFEKFGRADLPDGTVKNSLGPDVQKMVSNAMRFVAEGVRDGKNIPEILKDAVKKFGESVLDHIKGGLRDIGITDREIEGDRQYALNEIKKLADKEKSDMLTKSAVGKGLVRELVNSHIDNGLTGKDVFTELNKDLKEIFPEITEQQVRDAYLKEGEFTLDKKENINKAKVDAKNELRSIAKNETDIADLKAERDLRKREREERQKTDYENKLIAEKKELVDKKALTERQEKRLVELNKELDRIKQRKEKDAKVSNPKDLNRSDKEKAVLEEIKKEKEDWAKEKQAQRDLEFAAKKAQTAAKNEAERLKALTEKRDKLEKGQRDAPQVSTPKIESPAIEQVKAEIKEADKKLRYAESEANRLNKEMQAKRDKLAEHEANIKRAEKGLESIKTNRKKSDRQIDKEISDAETRLKKELNKKGLKLEKGSKAEREQKQKVADSHNQRTDKLIEGIDTKLQDDTLTEQEKTALENAKKILEKSKINPDSKLDIFDAVDKAEKNTELARAELANSNKLADIKHEISRSQIQMGKDKLQTEQDILLQRHKDNLQKKIDENERKLESGEYVEKEPARLKTSDAESIKLEIKDRETRNKLNAVGKAAQRAAMTKREKAIDTLQSLYVIGLVGRLSTLAKVGVSAITKQPLNTITSQTFGRLGGVLFPKIENALRGEGMESWRKEKNRYRAHYGALGERGMTKLIQKGKENAQKADENYINAKDKLEDLKNQFGEDSKQYKDFANGEFKKAENAQKQALLDNVTNSLYEWIGGNSWADAAEVFLHSSAKLEQLLGKGEKEMWADKTRKEKIMFVLSTSAATHGVLKNFSARAEFAANFVARLENKMKQGIDISSAEEILKTVNESYIAFQRGKYQEDNAITGGFKAGLEGLQRWAERHPDYKYAADLMAGALKFKNPIVRTPVNIAREAIVEYTLGVPLAIAKYRNSLKDAKVDAKQFDLAGQEMKDHMKKFMDNLSPDKADFIYRAFRKGGFGLGVMALTAMGGIQFGGFFNRDERRRKKGDDLGINEVAIGGQKLTHLQAKIFEHTSAFFPALLWSNWDRVRDENLKAGHGELGANLDAAMKDFQGMMDQIPIGNEMQNPLQGVQIPLIGPFLTEYAEATDVDANGEPIKRSPKGNPLEKVWQNIEMKIPGLRQNVPIRGSKSSEFSPEELKDQTFKFFNDKGINFPELNPEKIQTKEVNGKVIEKLSDYDTKVQEDFIKKKKEYLKEEFLKLKNGFIKVYVDDDGNATTTPSRKNKLKSFNELTKEQIQNVVSTSISGKVTEKVKKEVLKDKKPIK